MKVYENVKTKVQGLFLREENGKSVLLIDGKEKAYSQSTMKRWWREVEKQAQPVEENVEVVEPVEEVAPVEETVEPDVEENFKPDCIVEVPENVTETCISLVNDSVAKGCKINVTNSYVGIKVGKKTVMEIHSSKRGKTKLVVKSKAMPEDILNCILNNGGKVAPPSYGWSLDLQIKADQLTTSTIFSILDDCIKYEK